MYNDCRMKMLAKVQSDVTIFLIWPPKKESPKMENAEKIHNQLAWPPFRPSWINTRER